MNAEPNNDKIVWHFGVNFVVATLLFGIFVTVVKLSVAVPAIDADRAAVRAKDLAEIRVVEANALATAGWVDQARGIVRLPIETAMRIVVAHGEDPAKVRADLIARAAKAAAPLPQMPPQANPFE